MTLQALKRHWLPVAIIAALLLGVFCINRFCVDDHDTLSYAFSGQNSNLTTTHRVHSLSDIVRQQYRDYRTPGINGRVIVHGITALFSGFRLWTLFDVLNTLMWGLFTWLILREGGLRWGRSSPWAWAIGAAGVWWCLWYSETTLNIAFALNYLWTATATLLAMVLWRRLQRWMVPFAFLYGWTQECFVLPMIAALAGSMVIRSLCARRVAFTPQQAVAWGLMVVGGAFLILGPAASSRAASTIIGEGVGFMVAKIVRSQVSFVLLLWPPMLAALLLRALWLRRRELGATLMDSLEWWLYLAAAYASYLIISTNGVIRVAMPTTTALMVLVVRYRAHLPRWRSFAAVAVTGVLVWMGATAVLQFRLGREVRAMLARYQADPQGLTYREVITSGFLDQSIWYGRYNRFHRAMFTLETQHPAPMALFAPWLYQALNLAPETYFAVAEPVPGTPCFVAKAAPNVLVAPGEVVPTEAEAATIKAYLEAAPYAPVRSKYLPGRFSVMFPQGDDVLQGFPADRFIFTANDGKRYTLFTLSNRKPR
ncbi:MAG: DUF6056 family protein [Candidatus Spyradenecus sp.]